jgi:thioredoxin-related protein
MVKMFLLSFLFAALASGMQITDDASFKTIYEQKRNGNKIVLMLYTAKSCPQCAYMKQKVFQEPDVMEFMEEHFVVLEKDVSNDDLPSGFEYFGIPTIFFVDKDGVQIGKFIGSSRAKPFLEELRKIVKEKQ